MIDPTFRNVNKLLVLLIKNGDDDTTRNNFYKYYMPLVESKDFNPLIVNKPFFDQPTKCKQEAYAKPVTMSRNDDYATRNLLDNLRHQIYYKNIGIDSSRQTNTTISQ